jgi:hypothetical protein
MALMCNIVVILTWIMLIYFPLSAAYFALGIAFADNSESIWRKPFFGIRRCSTKAGSLIWLCQLIGFGIVLCEYGKWLHYGVCPFIAL